MTVLEVTEMTINEALEKMGLTLISNHSMTTDEVLNLFGLTVDDEGEIIDAEGHGTGIWYEEIQ